MAVPLIVIGVSVALAAAASIYALRQQSKQKNNNLSPQTLDSFGITQAKEGSVVPLVYGRVRIPGNIIFYGNLESREIFAEQESGGGGKGFGSSKKSQVTGYQYYMDVWQTICIGKCNLVKTYVNNNSDSPDVSETIFNDGTNGLYPSSTLVGEYGTQLKGICHIFYRQINCGENTTQLPTVHFVVQRVLSTGIDYENMANGNNPAAIVYDLLKQAGVRDNEIDTTSFNEAATFWNSRGYGLNLTIAEQKTLNEAINTVLSQVDGVFYVNSSGKYALSAYDPSRSVSATIPSDDFYDFSLRRQSYSQLPNDLRATYTDEDQDFSERTTPPYQNDASISLVGKINEKSIDLKGFRTQDSASKRLAEIAKYVTYPVAEISFTLNMKYATLVPGAIISISYDDLAIVSAKFRVDSLDLPGVDSLEIKGKATQVAEEIFDTNYIVGGGTLFEKNPMIPSDIPKYRSEVVLPYNVENQTEPTLMFLIERAKGYENGFYVEGRDGSAPTDPYNPGGDATGYHTIGFFTTTSRRIQCTFPTQYLESGADPTEFEHYPNLFDHTYMIDDGTVGITVFTEDSPLDLTQFPPINRTQLFSTNRVLYLVTNTIPIGSTVESKPEFICFQYIEAIANPSTGTYSDTSKYFFYKITSFMRSCLYTLRHSHEYNASYLYPKIGWLFKFGNNRVSVKNAATYRTILPSTLYEVASPANTHPMYPTGWPGKGNFTFRPDLIAGSGRIYATRSGSSISVKYYPATYSINGCGHGNPDEVVDQAAFDYDGYLYFEYGATIVEKMSPNVEISISDSNSVLLKIYVKRIPLDSNIVYGELTIDTPDGVYIGYTTRQIN